MPEPEPEPVTHSESTNPFLNFTGDVKKALLVDNPFMTSEQLHAIAIDFEAHENQPQSEDEEEGTIFSVQWFLTPRFR